jgi:hypothetical protein
VVAEFALSATCTLQAAQIVKNDRENPQAPRRQAPFDGGVAAGKTHRLL